MRRFGLGKLTIMCAILGMVILCSAASAAAPKQEFAYITYKDGSIDQYQINSGGQFKFLQRTSPNEDFKGSVDLAVDAAGRFAYQMGISGNIAQYRINEDGTLSLLRMSTIPISRRLADGIAVDPQGKYFYVTVHGKTNGAIVQYRINSNGTISPLAPVSVAAGENPGSIACHPTRPFAYVSNISEGTISQYRIGIDGQLKPLQPRKVEVGDRSGFITFSNDGNYVFVASPRSQNVVQLSIAEDGALCPVAFGSYNNESDLCCGYPQVLVDTSDTYLIVCDSTGDTIHRFRIADSKLENTPAESYKATHDNKLRSRKEMAFLRDKKLAEKGLPVESNRAFSEEPGVFIDRLSGIILAVDSDPTGGFYVLNSSGVARFKPNRDGVAFDIAPAVVWDDLVTGLAKNQEAKRGSRDGLRIPRWLRIVRR